MWIIANKAGNRTATKMLSKLLFKKKRGTEYVYKEVYSQLKV